MTDMQNPYSPPQSEVEVTDARRDWVTANLGRRFATLLIDYVLFMGFGFCFGVAVVLLFGEAGSHALRSIPDYVLGVFILSVYYIFFEGIWSRTPGKFICGTVVVSDAGTKPSLGQVVGRTLCRLIPFEPLSCLRDMGCWHDSIPKTRVVMVRGR